MSSSPEVTRFESASAAETRAIGARLARRLLPHGILLLYGEMGAGKTVLTQGLAAALGIEAEQVQSPTFTLVHEYQGEDCDVVHIDLYRLEEKDLPNLGLEELFERPGVKVVEWAERLPMPPEGALRVRLVALDEDRRRMTVEETVAVVSAATSKQ